MRGPRDLPDAGPFDLVYCLDSLHHISDPAAVLEGVHRALAPGGVVLVAENDLSGTSTLTPGTPRR